MNDGHNYRVPSRRDNGMGQNPVNVVQRTGPDSERGTHHAAIGRIGIDDFEVFVKSGHKVIHLDESSNFNGN